MKPSEYIGKRKKNKDDWMLDFCKMAEELDDLFISKTQHQKELEEMRKVWTQDVNIVVENCDIEVQKLKKELSNIRLRILDRLGFDITDLKEKKK